MTDLDTLLASLGERPLDPRLAAIDAGVFAGLAVEQRPALSHRALGLVAGLAMVTGVLATAWPVPAARAEGAYPLGVPHDLAPSTLLGEEP